MQGQNPDGQMRRQATPHSQANPHIDTALCRRAQQGDERAFAQLRDKYRPLVVTETRRRLYSRCQDDVEDIMQRVWSAAWKSLPNFQGRADFSTWLVGIVKNVVREWLREQKPTLSLDDASAPEPGDDCKAATQMLDRIVVQEAIKVLPEAQRIVICLRFFLQLTDEEIAERLNEPLGTIKSRLKSGQKKLHAQLQESIKEYEP